MKKGLSILFAVFLSVSCSSNDDSKPATVTTYGVRTEKTCPSGIAVSNQISKATYDYLKSLPITGSGCNWISIVDVDGKPVSGYLLSYSSPFSK